MKIEDHMTRLSNPIPATNPNTTQGNFYTDILKNRISELEKNATIDFFQLRLSPNLLIYRKIVKLIKNLSMVASY